MQSNEAITENQSTAAEPVKTMAKKVQEYALVHPVFNMDVDFPRAGSDPGQSKAFQLNNLYILSVITYVAPANKEMTLFNWHFVSSIRLVADQQKAVAMAYLNRRERDLLKSSLYDAAEGAGISFAGERFLIQSQTVHLIRPLNFNEQIKLDEYLESMSQETENLPN